MNEKNLPPMKCSIKRGYDWLSAPVTNGMSLEMSVKEKNEWTAMRIM